jgi:hypothetical protein
MVAGTLSPEDRRWWIRCIERLPAGVTEIGIHPGWDQPWRQLDTSPVLECGRKYLEDSRIRLIGFHELP